MNYFILLSFTWVLSQSLKYIIRILRLKKITVKETAKTFLFYSGPPSSHCAVLTASTLLLGKELGVRDPLFYVFSFFSMLWIFEIYMQRRRFQAQLELFGRATIDPHDLAVLKDVSGHSIFDIAAGILLGVLTFISYDLLLYG